MQPETDAAWNDGGVSDQRILIVDDNELIRSMCELALRRHGYRTATVDSADAALAELEAAADFGLVITDLTMPGARDGAGLVDAIRATRPELGVIVMTGNPAAAGQIDAMLLSKPFTIDELSNAVASVLGA
jgi:DNA-binding NtrC family response regulator